ncbi:MAG: hypothetical protein HYU85_01785 [Chloroflexi bacterium]|nr:hypothetical protein [Chloroflexota bacterium]MBI3040230.1 hypothetical protein [Chloroflexota bacterium]
MDNRGQKGKWPYGDEWITRPVQSLGHTNKTKMQVNVNLLKATKDTLERVVAREYVENEAQQILVSTTALLCDFLFNSEGLDSELRTQVQERQKELGLFFQPLIEAIFEWMIDGKEDIIEKIRVLAGSGK